MCCSLCGKFRADDSSVPAGESDYEENENDEELIFLVIFFGRRQGENKFASHTLRTD